MAQRIVIEYGTRPSLKRRRWESVNRLLEGAGGHLLHEPEGAPPYVLVAVLPSKARALKVIEQLRSTEGVISADLDQLAWAV